MRRALGLTDFRARELVSRLNIPTLVVDSTVLVDAGVCERAIRLTLGEEQADAIRQARGGHTLPVVVSQPTNQLTDPRSHAQSVTTDENVETMLREALNAHGGLLSYPLYRTWAVETGRKPLDMGTVVRHLGVRTWKEALEACGGRRGVTTPGDRAAALDLLAEASAAHGGHLTMDQYRDWARRQNARWRDPARVAQATGQASWNDALSAAIKQNTVLGRGNTRTSEGDAT